MIERQKYLSIKHQNAFEKQKNLKKIKKISEQNNPFENHIENCDNGNNSTKAKLKDSTEKKIDEKENKFESKENSSYLEKKENSKKNNPI